MKTAEQLIALATEVADAYNSASLDRIANLFDPEGVFCSPDNESYQGDAAIREATTALLALGRLEFEGEDLFVDTQSQKAMLSWKLHAENDELKSVFRGADILHWKNDKLILKSTYFKTDIPKAVV